MYESNNRNFTFSLLSASTGLTQTFSSANMIETGFFKGTYLDKADNRVYSNVNPLELSGDAYCSSVLISPDIALTAAHCVDGDVTGWKQDEGADWGAPVAIAETWIGRNYKHGESGDVPSHEDFGIVRLATPAPANITYFEVAKPDEVYIGQPAATVGYPAYTYNGNQRVVGSGCRIRGFSGDVLKTDCYLSEGMSGGPLLVKTKSGKWKIAGLASEEVLSDGRMIMGDAYSSGSANTYVNVTHYRGRISKSTDLQL